MKTTASLAAFAATAAAQQFVVYSNADSSYSQRADPIISPGELSGHVHDFLGAGAMAPELSYDALMNTDCTTVGAADGSALESDKSVYWHPALYAKSKDGSGWVKVKTTSHKMYYRKKAENMEEFPKDFRMIAGNPFLRSPNSNLSTITEWTCYGPDVTGEGGGFPTLNAPCNTYPGFMGKVHFPHCWNGDDFNQEDPSAHMAYPEGNPQDAECPSSHPKVLPHIFMENTFEMTETYNQIDTSTLTLAQGDNTGFGWHADFFNGWVSGDITDLFDNCAQGEYGNHDVGECSTVKLSSQQTSDCKLKNYFEEKVDAPGANLCGCNPISDVDPAPMLAIAELGISTDSCGAGSGSSSGGGDDYEAPSSSAAAPSSAASGVMSILPFTPSYAAPSTTFAVSATAAAPAPEQSYSGWGDSEEEEDDDEYDYVTEWVTATAEATVYAKRDVHNHMNAHRRRHFH